LCVGNSNARIILSPFLHDVVLAHVKLLPLQGRPSKVYTSSQTAMLPRVNLSSRDAVTSASTAPEDGDVMQPDGGCAEASPPLPSQPAASQTTATCLVVDATGGNADVDHKLPPTLVAISAATEALPVPAIASPSSALQPQETEVPDAEEGPKPHHFSMEDLD
jgi:hypothetical protein